MISVDKPASILTQVFVRQQPVGTPSGNGARYGFHYNADPGDSAPQRIAATGHSGVVERNAGGTSAPANSPVWESWCGGSLP